MSELEKTDKRKKITKTEEIPELGVLAVLEKQNDGEWRVSFNEMKSGFSDFQKKKFLLEIARNGLFQTACNIAGVSAYIAKKHLEEDDEFREVFEMMEASFADKVVGELQNIAMNGSEELRFDAETGALIGKKWKRFPTLLLEEVRRRDSSYTPKKETTVNHNINAGVLVAPKAASTIEDWEKRFGKQDDGKVVTEDVVDADFEDVSESVAEIPKGKSLN